MPPQTSTIGSLDPQAVALAKAIRQTESGGNFSAKGKSGEYGAYQYTEPTWAKDASSVGINVPLSKATPEQQNQVAYTKIKQWKDAGYNPGQIASMWNAGEGEPDAYTGKFSNGQPSVGVNKYGVHFSVPNYAKSVATAYQTLKQGGQVNVDPNNPSSTANQTPVQLPQEHKSLGDTVSNIIQTVFPGQKIGEAIGTEIAKLQHPDQAQFIQQYEPGPTGLQVAGDVAQAGLMTVAPGIGSGAGLLARLGGTAAVGAASGAAGALTQGSRNPSNIASQAATGGLIGGALGGSGELVGKAAQYLPYRIARTFLPGTSQETAQYAVSKGLGSPTKMLATSDAGLTDIGGKIESVLNHPELSGLTATANDVYSPIISRFGDAGLTPEEVGNQIRRLVPLQKNLVDKLETTGLNAAELNRLKSAIGKSTYKTVFDEPAVKAGKEIGNTAYSAISQWLEEKVPEAAPLFQEYTKELQLNKALTGAIRRGEKARPFTLRDIVALLAGAPLGLGGSLGALAAEKALTSPTVNLKAAGALSRVPTGAIGAISRTALSRGVASIPGKTGQ